MSLVKKVSGDVLKRKVLALGICVFKVGKHITLGICVSQVVEHITLGICRLNRNGSEK